MLPAVRIGADRLFDEQFSLIAGKRVGLITNPSGVDGELRATADRLRERDGVELVRLFGPEHGIRGDAQDGVALDSEVGTRTGVATVSLYGERRAPTTEDLADLDLLIFDIQDVGVRFYTYLYTMSLAMEACAEVGLPFLVLDRPNPLGGKIVEGNVLDPEFASFVGLYPIPVRYGLTIGEIASYFNEELSLGCNLQVVELAGWRRSFLWEETGLCWVPPSPNMPTADAALIYPGMCFFEGTNLSEGRGTTRPFEQIGAPFLDPGELARRLQALDLPGVLFRDVTFTPSFGKFTGESCGGVHVHVRKSQGLHTVELGFHVLTEAMAVGGDRFEWRAGATGIHNFDKLAGSDRVRLSLDSGTSVLELTERWAEERKPFERRRSSYLRYPD
ncbi:MAG: DUF1343 domain-containing protein [Candidatus Latescibacterota bacterium]|nr:DUF1343 domain-containing protein [Candidatus Latescibacterota bacterium]